MGVAPSVEKRAVHDHKSKKQGESIDSQQMALSIKTTEIEDSREKQLAGKKVTTYNKSARDGKSKEMQGSGEKKEMELGRSSADGGKKDNRNLSSEAPSKPSEQEALVTLSSSETKVTEKSKSNDASTKNYESFQQYVQLVHEYIDIYGGGGSETDAEIRTMISGLSHRALEISNSYGETLSINACRKGAYDLLLILLEKGANPNATSHDGWTPLHFVCHPQSTSFEVVERLLDFGANVDATEYTNGCTPLHWAAAGGNLRICKLLLDAGANAEICDTNGCNSVDYSSEFKDCRNFLLKWTDGESSNSKGSKTLTREWIEYVDQQTGETYFYNMHDGTSLWEDDFRAKFGENPAKSSHSNKHSPFEGPDDELEEKSESILKTKSAPVTKHHINLPSGSPFRQSDVGGSQSPIEENDFEKHTIDRASENFEDKLSNIQTRLEVKLENEFNLLKSKLNVPREQSIINVDQTDLRKKEKELIDLKDKIIKLQEEVNEKGNEIICLRKKMHEMEQSSKPDTGNSKRGISESELQSLGWMDPSNSKEMKELLEAEQKKLETLQRKINDLQKESDITHDEIVRLKTKISKDEEKIDSISMELEKERLENRERLLEVQSMQKGQKDDFESNKHLREEMEKDRDIISKLQKELRKLENEKQKALEEHRLEIKGQKLLIEEKEATLRCKEELLKKSHESAQKKLDEAAVVHKEEISQFTQQIDLAKLELMEKEMEVKRLENVVESAIQEKDKAVFECDNAVSRMHDAERQLGSLTSLVAEAQTLAGQNEKLHVALHAETARRKELHNTLEDMKGRIRVYVRIRPFSKSEEEKGCTEVVQREDKQTCIMTASSGKGEDSKVWEFDQVFGGAKDDGNTQEAVFQDTKLLITSVVDGFNVCIFAYGQTGSGKTYTMFGKCLPGQEFNDDGMLNEECGLSARAAAELFRVLRARETANEITVSASMFELYNDGLYDLLCEHQGHRNGLHIKLAQHTSSGMVEVEGSVQLAVSNERELLKLFEKGIKRRTVSATQMNAESSRSHLIVVIKIELKNKRSGKTVRGKLTLVDLAGSERLSKSGAVGAQNDEARSINMSLSALGNVINALNNGDKHIPYRSNELTKLMSDSIGGSAKTLMFLCCSPADYNQGESNNSLDFAKRCKNVTNNVCEGAKIQILQAQLEKLKRERGVDLKANSTLPKRPAVKSPVKSPKKASQNSKSSTPQQTKSKPTISKNDKK